MRIAKITNKVGNAMPGCDTLNGKTMVEGELIRTVRPRKNKPVWTLRLSTTEGDYGVDLSSAEVASMLRSLPAKHWFDALGAQGARDFDRMLKKLVEDFDPENYPG